jgi:UPF0716 protein FxsA
MRRRLGWLGLGLLAVVVAELASLILVAHWIGLGYTVLLVVVTSLLGGWLLRRAGVRAWRGLRTAAQSGRPPGPELTSGLLGLASAVLLVVPGFLTDLTGLILLTGPARALAAGGVQRLVERQVSAAAAGDLFGPRRVRVRRGAVPQPTPAAEGDLIEGEIVEPR